MSPILEYVLLALGAFLLYRTRYYYLEERTLKKGIKTLKQMIRRNCELKLLLKNSLKKERRKKMMVTSQLVFAWLIAVIFIIYSILRIKGFL